MIHKMIAIVLTLATVVTLCLAISSYHRSKPRRSFVGGVTRTVRTIGWQRGKSQDGAILYVYDGGLQYSTHAYVKDRLAVTPVRRLDLGIFRFHAGNSKTNVQRQIQLERRMDPTRPPGGPATMLQWVIYIRLWYVLPILAAYPIIAFIRGPYRRWRRPRKGLCIQCGYDFTGNESGVCPECGTECGKT